MLAGREERFAEQKMHSISSKNGRKRTRKTEDITNPLLATQVLKPYGVNDNGSDSFIFIGLAGVEFKGQSFD